MVRLLVRPGSLRSGFSFDKALDGREVSENNSSFDNPPPSPILGNLIVESDLNIVFGMQNVDLTV